MEQEVIEISTILICSREGSLSVIWIQMLVREKVQVLNYLTHADSIQNCSRSRLYLGLNMNDFGKIVNFNGIFYHPYFCVNKQNVKNMNPRQCASVKSRSQYSNAPRLQSKIIPVTDISCLEHAHFWGNCDFEQQFIPSLFAHDIG